MTKDEQLAEARRKDEQLAEARRKFPVGCKVRVPWGTEGEVTGVYFCGFMVATQPVLRIAGPLGEQTCYAKYATRIDAVEEMEGSGEKG